MKCRKRKQVEADAASPSPKVTKSRRNNKKPVNRKSNAIIKNFREMTGYNEISNKGININWDGSIELLEEYIREEGEEAGKALVSEKDKFGNSSLVRAIGSRAAKSRFWDIDLKLIKIGGKDIVLSANSYGINLLQSTTCSYPSIPMALFLKLVEVGGKELDLVVEKTANYGRKTPFSFEWAYKFGINSARGTSKFIGKGDLFLDNNPLFDACCDRAPADVVTKLIEVAGEDLILSKDKADRNLLQKICLEPMYCSEKRYKIGEKQLHSC